ncbi:CGCGG family rSAM-modified RiPP protein [Halorubrum sp. DTA98]|uniref:CGCGG family putative rSAM-modified RiPP protein n=1 Tax=Halorubrum sp. DTA98 TaxID=3402163 RepID=UPI003AAA3261
MDGRDATETTAGERPAFLDAEHAGSWSANLELDQYADDRERLVDHALVAVDRTAAGHHVNLVTHPNHGNPEEYLRKPIRDSHSEATTELVDQCGCGGYVYRVER